MTEKLFNEIATWQQDTFPTGTPDSTLHHLLDEIRELRYALRFDWPNAKEELADCMFLLFGCADRMGMSYQDIQDAIQAKFEKNKARTWGQPDDNGVVKHIEPTYTPSLIASPGEGAVIVEPVKECFRCGTAITLENNGICINEGTNTEVFQCDDCHEMEFGVRVSPALLYFKQPAPIPPSVADGQEETPEQRRWRLFLENN
jgi:NTP pyrophosphatase (non-canonical NTP hydrolase)